MIEARRPGTGGSSSGGITSDGPSTPATEGISTTVLASPVTPAATTGGFGQQLDRDKELEDVSTPPPAGATVSAGEDSSAGHQPGK